MENIDKTRIDTNPPGARMRLGPYETTDLLGRGGMAVVYKGLQQSLGRVVAIKVLPKEFSRDRQFVGRFHREAESVAKLNHPNIIQIIDKGEDNGTCYFVMEYVKGQSLAQRLQSKGIDFKELIQIAMQVCSALHYAHEQGVVHRDIKPANILIDEGTGVAKVADFGIAQLAEKSTAIGTLTGDHMAMGTLDYMAPEQKRDAKNVDRRADVYSIGVMLYEMATGRVPMGIFDPPSKLNRDVTKDFDTIVMRCLRDKPADRFASCQELINAMTALPQSPSTMIRVISSVKSAATAMGTSIGKGRPLAVGAVLMLAIGLALGGWGIAKYSRKDTGTGGGAGGGGTGAGGAGAGTDVPKADPEKEFREKIEAARGEAADGKVGSIFKALARLVALVPDAPAACREELKAAIEDLQTRKSAAATAAARENLAELLREAPDGGDYGLSKLEALLAEATASGADTATLREIGESIEHARKRSETAGADAKERVRIERFGKALEKAQQALTEKNWEEALAAASEADPYAATDAEKSRISGIRTRVAAEQAAEQTAEQNRRDFLKAVKAARESIDSKAWGVAREEAARAKGYAKTPEESAEAETIAKEVELKEAEDRFVRLMNEAAAREAATPAQARDKYLEAARVAPTEDDRKAANDKAAAVTKRLETEKREQDYQTAIKAARIARDAKNWASALDWARKALAAHNGDKEAGEILREAEEALKAKPPDPPPVDPPKAFALKLWKALPGTLRGVGGVAVDPKGIAYVNDNETRILHRYDAQGNETGTVLLSTLRSPDRIACDSRGNLWVLDLTERLVMRVDPATGAIQQKVGTFGKGENNIYNPKTFAVDGNGDVFVTDGSFCRVGRFGSDGVWKKNWGRKWDKQGDSIGEFSRPEGIAVAPDGSVWVSDYNTRLVQRFSVEGAHIETIKTPLVGPLDVACRGKRVYVLEYDQQRVSVFDETGKLLAQVGSKAAGPEQLSKPWMITVGPDGKVYVGDRASARVVVWEESK
jgi:sugar lactone lactonase YvrE/predicted Ser/Thr protein kinase